MPNKSAKLSVDGQKKPVGDRYSATMIKESDYRTHTSRNAAADLVRMAIGDVAGKNLLPESYL